MSNYRIIRHRYALDVAVKAKTEHVFGNYIQIVKASSLNASIGVEMMGDNLKTEGALELRNRDYIRVPDPFGRVDLSWDAQPGEWVEVIFITQDPAPEEFDYMTQERGFIDSIANAVTVHVDSGDSINTGYVNIAGVATLIVPANPNRKSLVITNDDFDNAVILGKVGVSSGNGHRIFPSGTYCTTSKAAFYGVAANGISQNVSYIEEV